MRLRRIVLFSCGAGFGAACSAPPREAARGSDSAVTIPATRPHADSSWEYRAANDTLARFPGFADISLPGVESLTVEGWLGTERPAFLVLSGYELGDGDYNGPVLHLLRPGEEIRWTGKVTPRPQYPGELRDMRDSLIAQSRAFVGHCLDSTRVMVEVIRYRPRRRGPWRDSTHVFSVQSDTLIEVANPPGAGLASIHPRVSDGSCHEIRPVNHRTPSDEGDDEDGA
jgi:hypothetical protein